MHGPVCSQCGQKQALPIETKRVAGDIWNQLVDFDFRFVRTFKTLFTNPGLVLNGYLAGQRITFTNPFKLLFFTATAYFLVIHFLDIKIDRFSAQDTGRMVAAFLNYLVFIFLIPAALILKLLFRHRRMNMAEAYVMLSYLWSAYLLLAIVSMLLLQAYGEYLFYARTLIAVVLFTYVFKQTFAQSLAISLWKAVVLYVGYVLATMLVMSAVIGLSYLVGFEPLMIPFGR